MQRVAGTVFVVVLVTLAGCSGVFGGGGEPRETLTPVSVPTDEPTPTPVPQLAPGLTGEGVADAFTLAEAHADALDNISYTRHSTLKIQYANGTIFRLSTGRSLYAVNDSQFYTMAQFDTLQNMSDLNRDGVDRISKWSNGKRVIVTRTSNNTTSYTISRNGDGEPIPPRELSFGAREEQIALLFSSSETRVTDRTTRNGTTLYEIEATNITNQAAFEGVWQNPRNISYWAQISSQGVVREYRQNYQATLNGNPVHIHRQVRYTDLGNTTVKRPPWYDEAIENVSTTTVAEQR